MRWWWRVTCTPITKYWWSVYGIMYRRFQYLFYFTNIGWVMDWSDVCQIFWIELIWVGLISINVNWVGIFLIPILNWVGVIPTYRIFAPKIFNLKIILRSALLIFFCLQGYLLAFHFSFYHAVAIPLRRHLASFLLSQRCCSCLIC